MNEHNVLDDGCYVGLRDSIRDFRFRLPKVNTKTSDVKTVDQLWTWLCRGPKVTTQSSTPVNNAQNEKSTQFSGWKRVTAAKQTLDKALAAPDIYKAAGGGDPFLASQSVKEFKQLAARVLQRCAETGQFLDSSIENEINVKACVVHEVKVLVLNVSSTDNGGRFDENTKKWYCEKVVRKFYTFENQLSGLLSALADEIADGTTNVTPEGKLVAVRNDGVTPRTGHNARQSNFTIKRVDYFGESDQGLKAIVERLKSKVHT